MADDRNFLEQFAKKLYARKACYHPLAPADCSGGIIEAHTVPHSGLLRIAQHGEIYTYNYVTQAARLRHDRMQPIRQGASRASTFGGFCQTHDQATFAPIEVHPFRVDPHHIFLASYRGLCLRLFRQQAHTGSGQYGHISDASLAQKQWLRSSQLGILGGNESEPNSWRFYSRIFAEIGLRSAFISLTSRNMWRGIFFRLCRAC